MGKVFTMKQQQHDINFEEDSEVLLKIDIKSFHPRHLPTPTLKTPRSQLSTALSQTSRGARVRV